MLRRLVRAPVYLDRRGHYVQAARVLPLVIAIHDHLQQGRDVHLGGRAAQATGMAGGNTGRKDQLGQADISFFYQDLVIYSVTQPREYQPQPLAKLLPSVPLLPPDPTPPHPHQPTPLHSHPSPPFTKPTHLLRKHHPQ